MFKKYISFTIVPNTSEKVKRFQISVFNIVLFSCFFLALVMHAFWLINTYFVEETIYSANFIKKKFERQKILLEMHEKDVDNLRESIDDLDDYYERLVKLSIPTEKSPVKESTGLIREVEQNKKSIFSLISSEESFGIELDNVDFENLQDFFRRDFLNFEKPSELPVAGFIVSSFGVSFNQKVLQYSPRSGILLYTDPNAVIRATQDGIVVYIGVDDILTKTVIIYHGNYLFTKYGYLSNIEVKKLQKVKKGDIIGISGGEDNSFLFYQVDFLYAPQSPF